MQRVTCDCGNTLYFGDEDEFQVCVRCGQKTSVSGGPMIEEPREKPRRRPAVTSRPEGVSAGPGAAAGLEGATGPPPPAAMPIFVPRVRLGFFRRTFRLVFRLPLLIVALAAAAGWDYHLYPRRKLPCGHMAKEPYVFGLVRIHHHCPAMKALRYIDTARRAIVKELDADREVPPNLQVIKALPGVREPAADVHYEFTVEKDLSLTADPSDPESDLPSFYLELDGTIYADGIDEELGAGRFDARGWFVPVEVTQETEDGASSE